MKFAHLHINFNLIDSELNEETVHSSAERKGGDKAVFGPVQDNTGKGGSFCVARPSFLMNTRFCVDLLLVVIISLFCMISVS